MHKKKMSKKQKWVIAKFIVSCLQVIVPILVALVTSIWTGIHHNNYELSSSDDVSNTIETILCMVNTKIYCIIV